MPKYRKKPVVIEAFEFRSTMAPEDMPNWAREALRADVLTLTDDGWYVQTLEGGILAPRHKISENDWLIQGVAGELYPCKPDIFEATYDPAA